MSRVLQPSNPTQAPVIPGAQVVTQMPMATAVNAGDYVYLTQTGVGVAASSGSAGVLTQVIGSSSVTTTLSTGSLPGYQYGPIVQQGTYTGTTYTLNQQLVAQTLYLGADSTTSPQFVTALQNGNFAVAYVSGGYLQYVVYDQTGAVVTGPTLIVLSSSLSTGNTNATITIFPTNSGGFGIAYGATAGGTTVTVKLYNSAGTALSTNTFTVTGSTLYYGLAIVQLTNNNYAVLFKDSSYYGYWMVLSSAFATVASGNVHFNTSYRAMSNAWGLVPLTQGGFVIHYFNSVWWFNGFTNAGVAFSEWPVDLSKIFPNKSSNDNVTSCPTSDGNMALSYVANDTNMYVVRLTVNIAGGGFGTYSLSNGIPANGSGSTVPVTIFPTQNNGVGVYYLYGGNTPYVSYSTTPNTVTSGVPSTTMNAGASLGVTVTRQYYNNCMFFNNSSQRTFIPYAGTSNNGYFQIISSIALTNGQTITGTSFAPPAYLFQGVALNAVSAGQVANVVINGVATLNSNYPSLSSTVPFDFSGFGPFGNKGQVYARTVTLRGVE